MTGKMKVKDDFQNDSSKKTYFDDENAKDKIHKPLKIFCGEGGSGQFSVSNATPVNVGFVTVDARVLYKPLVKIKFSSTFNLLNGGSGDLI